MKKIGLICLALVLALGALGVGFAMWDKTLYIDGTVNTGEVNAIFTTASCTEDPEVEGKDVGSCTLTGIGEQTLTITIDNGYPCYGCTVDFTVDNIGTIPVKVQSLTIVNPPPEISFTWSGIAVGDQIDGGDSQAGSIYVHVEQEADELAGVAGSGIPSYTFSAVIYLVQWNEYTP